MPDGNVALALFPRLPDSLTSRLGPALTRRLLTALALAPPVLLAVVLGPPWSDLLLLLLAAVMAWEWGRICRRGKALRLPELALTAIVPAVVLLAMVFGVAGAMIGFLGALLLLLVAWRASPYQDAPLTWLVAGLFYVALPLMLLHWLRGDDREGRDLVLWLLLVIWAVDSGAYAFGKAIGGPRLAPLWSPNKTWAGLFGGAASAVLVGWLVALILDMSLPGLMAILAGCLAFVGQGGDLLESAFKRHFGVKDASGLIPGHGGVLDRVDGLVAITLPVAGLAALGVLGS